MAHKPGPFLWFFFLILLLGCESNYTPKPHGYFRIDLPEKEYLVYDSVQPYSFEYPSYSHVGPDPKAPQQMNWLNVEFPTLGATLHLSYKPVNNNLYTYLEDSYTLVSKHIPKADAIDDSVIYLDNNKVYGLVYSISGSEAASPYQFFVTDSISHFIRGALYFNVTPNNDSLAPVIDFLKSDIHHLLSTLHWKESANATHKPD